MTFAQIGFYLLSAFTVAAALLAVTMKDVTRALLALIAFFFGVAGLFFVLHAEFIGVVQLLVYVGAVAVLIVFAIVLTRGAEGGVDLPRIGGSRIVGALAALLVGGVLVAVIERSRFPSKTAPALDVGAGGPEQIGEALMTRFALPFEVASLLLTAALIGAVVIALDEKSEKQKKEGGQ